jgi:multisubunit Na+/H+ antiporter MnhF subunit
MNVVFIICYLILFGAIILGIIRFGLGPTTLDRILAFDTIAISSIGIIIVFSIQEQTIFFLDTVLIYCLLGFTSTVAFINYLFKVHMQESNVSDDN